MIGRLAALYRHPVKGFTPERLAAAVLEAGSGFPLDRHYAVENGPSGFDPAQPRWPSKSRFTVLAAIPEIARVRTRYDDATGRFHVSAEGRPAADFDLEAEAGRAGLADWLEGFLDPAARRGALRVLTAPGPRRFTDDAAGAVSLINLESLRELSSRLGRPVEPSRFRANVHVEGWSAWAELGMRPGAVIRLGEAEVRVVKPIVRCAATHVDPARGVRDLELTTALRAHYGHLYCGLYVQVAWGGRLAEGDPATVEGPDWIGSRLGGERPPQPVVEAS